MASEEAKPEPCRSSRLSIAAVLFFVAVVLVGGILALGLLGRETPRLEFIIRIDAAEFAPDDPMVVHGRLENHDDKPIRIFPPAVSDFTFELIVLDSDGHRYEKHVPYQRGMKPQRASRELRPGEQVTVEEDLRAGYGIVPGKKYSIRGAYRTLNFPNENVWYGIIKSNELDIVVRAE